MTGRISHRSLVVWIAGIATAWTALIAGALAWHLRDNSELIGQLAEVAQRSNDPRDARYRDPAVLALSLRRTEFAFYVGTWSLGMVVLGAAALVVQARRRERRVAEAKLRESEERYRSLLELSPEGVIAHSDGRCTYINTVGARLFGASDSGELIGKRILDLVHPDYRDMVSERISRAMEYGEPAPLREMVLMRLDGQAFHAETKGVPLVLAGQKTSLSIIRDITERKRAEAEKAALEAQLHQAQKMESVGRLAGGVAHEFNNMLGVILGYAEMALDQLDPAEPLHADLQEIHKAATRSADVTRQLLAFARKQIVAPRVLDLNETVAGLLDMLGRLIGEDIRVTWQPAAALWPIKADPGQVGQLLSTLCLNARDAISGTGQLTIETGNTTIDEAYCAAHPDCVPGEYVLLAVSDDGCGMDNETLAKLFEPFFTTKGVGRGTGLGLATVYGIVKQNAGFVTVASEPGIGTTFRIHLPRHAVEAVEALSPAVADTPKVCGQTILLAEDEPAILKLTTTLLEKEGYTVLAAGTPEEAIRLAREHVGEIHVVMTDVVMPEMNGQDLVTRVVALRPTVRSLFMSGYPADIIAARGVLDGDVPFIQKPFTRHALAAKVRQALGGE